MAAAVLLALTLGGWACSGDVEHGPGSGGDEDGGGRGGDGFTDGAAKTCQPPCTAPKTCSKAGVCIDPGTCAHDGDCPSNMECDLATGKCRIKGQCGSEELVAEVVPPNMLVVLDRSCSMRTKVGTKPKWQIAVDALVKLLNSNLGKMRWGLILFPDTKTPKCTQQELPVALGASTESKIQTLLTKALSTTDTYYPDGPCVTNIDTAMKQAAAQTALKDTTRESYVLLITDGAQAGCSAAGGDSGTTSIITDLYQKLKVPTFVVGFGSAVDKNQLNIFATAGGMPSGDPTFKYYKAEDQTTLDAALAKIVSKSFSCIVKLKKVPATLDKIYVFFDNVEVKRDTSHKNGWDYDSKSNQITFYGKACQDLKGNKVKDVDIVFGCKATTDGGPSLFSDGSVPKCPTGVKSCVASGDCGDPKMACVAGCCINIPQ